MGLPRSCAHGSLCSAIRARHHILHPPLARHPSCSWGTHPDTCRIGEQRASSHTHTGVRLGLLPGWIQGCAILRLSQSCNLPCIGRVSSRNPKNITALPLTYNKEVVDLCSGGQRRAERCTLVTFTEKFQDESDGICSGGQEHAWGVYPRGRQSRGRAGSSGWRPRPLPAARARSTAPSRTRTARRVAAAAPQSALSSDSSHAQSGSFTYTMGVHAHACCACMTRGSGACSNAPWRTRTMRHIGSTACLHTGSGEGHVLVVQWSILLWCCHEVP